MSLELRLCAVYFAGLMLAWAALASLPHDDKHPPEVRIVACGLIAAFWPVLLMGAIVVLALNILAVLYGAVYGRRDVGRR